MGDYFKKWYEEKGPELNARRRSRYARDPEYRARVKGHRKAHYLKQAQARDDGRDKRVQPQSAGWRCVSGAVDQRTQERVAGTFFTVAALARALGVTTQLVRIRERRGSLSPTPYRSEAGFRLYTLEQIEEQVRERGTAPARGRAVGPCGQTGFARFRREHPDGAVFYTSGALALVLGISTDWLRRLERRGLLPPPACVRARGRLYTLEQLEAASEAATDYDKQTTRFKRDWHALSVCIRDRWPAAVHMTRDKDADPPTPSLPGVP